MTLDNTIPLFPLPNVVLFPDVFLPLHIFEPRYREMTRTALDSNRLIGMVLQKPAASDAVKHFSEQTPPAVFPVGCAGVITHVEEVDGGRYNIILRGLHKFRILGEETTDIDAPKPYRVARIEGIPETAFDKGTLRDDRQKLEALLVSSGTENFSFRLPPSMPDVEFVHALSQYFGFEAIERQALLELGNAEERCRALIELVEMQLLMGGKSWGSTTS